MKKYTEDIRGYAWYYFRRTKLNLIKVFSNLFMKFICTLKGVTLGRNVRFVGLVKLHRYPLSKIIIGDNCRFNSSKDAVSIGLYKPCSFTTLRKNAEIKIGKNVGGTSVIIAAANSITIGDNVLIGANTFIMDTDWHNTEPDQRTSDNVTSAPILIEDNVFLGYNCVVLKGVTIGSNSVIGANSLVINNIPANSIALGNPCKVLIRRNWKETTNNNDKDN